MEEKPGRKKSVAQRSCSGSEDLRATLELKARLRENLPNQPTYPPWVRAYRAHTEALNNMKAKVDTSPPIVAKAPFVASGIAFNRKGFRYQKIEIENSMLLKKIADIYTRRKGFVANQVDYRDLMRNRGLVREREQMRLVFENVKIYNKINNVKPTMSRVELSKWYQEQERLMQHAAIYPLHFMAPPCSSKIRKILQRASEQPVIQASFQLTTEDGRTGNVTFELYSNLCPFTVENFRRMCKTKNSKMSWKDKGLEKLVSVVLPGGRLERMYWQIGREAEVYPILKPHMPTELSNLRHNKAWLLTKPREIVTGEFYITTHPAPYLDKLCNVFGKVTEEEGIRFLEQMEKHNVNPMGTTRSKIVITNCFIGNATGTEGSNEGGSEPGPEEE